MPALDRFSEPTRAWFTGAFAEPTAAQDGAWQAISSGEHALVVAPTGSGKTLSAFLWALDRLGADPLPDGAKAAGTRVRLMRTRYQSDDRPRMRSTSTSAGSR